MTGESIHSVRVDKDERQFDSIDDVIRYIRSLYLTTRVVADVTLDNGRWPISGTALGVADWLATEGKARGAR